MDFVLHIWLGTCLTSSKIDIYIYIYKEQPLIFNCSSFPLVVKILENFSLIYKCHHFHPFNPRGHETTKKIY
jgi:hypothetical protein